MASSNPTHLAIYGGPRAITESLPPMYPGGMKIDEEEEKAVLDVLRTKRLFRYYGPQAGPSQVQLLEEEFRAFMGSPYSVAVTSGTAALISGLIGLGIGPGDEVIIPAFTWIASASAVVAVGAVPIVAEVDETLTLDPTDVEAKISAYTKAILPVHMRGAPCNMPTLVEIASKHNLSVLEDTAQADGASLHGQRLGTFGDAGAFSLQFNKIITSGEGGMLLCKNEQVYQRAVMYHDVVGGQRNQVPENKILPGINFRMPELLGAVARVQLRRLDALLSAMRQRKRMLKSSLEGLAKQKDFQFQASHDPDGEAGICLILILPDVGANQRVAQALSAEGLPNWILYSPDEIDYHVYPHWAPIMGQRTWHRDGGPWKNHPRKIEYQPDICQRSLDLLGRCLHFDISPELNNSQVEEMSEALNKVLGAFL